MIQRYMPIPVWNCGFNTHEADMEEHKNGEYVKYSDYRQLADANEILCKEVEKIKKLTEELSRENLTWLK